MRATDIQDLLFGILNAVSRSRVILYEAMSTTAHRTGGALNESESNQSFRFSRIESNQSVGKNLPMGPAVGASGDNWR
jgi:hypothetical protein